MKVLVGVSLLLLCFVSRVKAVTVESCPLATGSLLRTEVEKTVTLTCMTDEGIDPSNQKELQWFRNGARVNLTEENRLYQSSLCVQPVTKEDNGVVFTCQLKGDATVNSSIEFDVQYPPDLNDTKEVFVEETSDVVLSCDVRANPPVTVTWKKDGEVLDLISGSYKTTNNGITALLLITTAKRDVHQGTYICEVNSSVYGIMGRTFIIMVEDKVLRFPLGPTIAGVVVVLCTIVFAIISRRNKIIKCIKPN
ncbi:transmembrane and immunoglobulin domain-containing protein 1-like [Sinocyclocheilus anshuiensis]|nr:PREDICTED: transmembrane and immunoglobulin domain-containing protein 1-like [Sinocyclocheilus anshuiensis]XP_016335905.1 PREDICTED: transmembrane and immunoglobulin domain-containing protein 1-like [Sinocyclocheilus anshuiensis]